MKEYAILDFGGHFELGMDSYVYIQASSPKQAVEKYLASEKIIGAPVRTIQDINTRFIVQGPQGSYLYQLSK